MIVMPWWTALALVCVAVFWIGMAAYCGYHAGRSARLAALAERSWSKQRGERAA